MEPLPIKIVKYIFRNAFSGLFLSSAFVFILMYKIFGVTNLPHAEEVASHGVFVKSYMYGFRTSSAILQISNSGNIVEFAVSSLNPQSSHFISSIRNIYPQEELTVVTYQSKYNGHEVIRITGSASRVIYENSKTSFKAFSMGENSNFLGHLFITIFFVAGLLYEAINLRNHLRPQPYAAR